jgi:hypothetical protein
VFKPSTLIHRALRGLIPVILVALAAGCGGGGGSAPTTGAITASGEFGASGAPVCTDHSTWVFDPLTAESGATSGVFTRQTFMANDDHISPVANVCTSHGFAGNLRFGTWRVSWSGRPGQVCTLNIRVNNWVTLKQNGTCQMG